MSRDHKKIFFKVIVTENDQVCSTCHVDELCDKQCLWSTKMAPKKFEIHAYF